ncbi:roadblock/LC7 domain-containing protein [Streptomyces sp. NPDC048639]|uniref:roadblock/LC7 domain-containing protein n=1 Tax=Streptomyces sp. NPDC048639 TaxID=3365581 RepID=UPI0037198BCE
MTRDDRGTERRDGGLDWLLDDLVARTEHVRQAVLLSADGLPTSASEGLSAEDIDHLAAVSSGFHSLALGLADRFAAGGVRQTMIMLDDAYLFVTPAGRGSRLAVLAGAETDTGQLGYEMSLLVKRVGRHLAAPPRAGSETADG